MSFLQRDELLKDSEMPDVQYDGTFDIGTGDGSDSDWNDDNTMDTEEPGFNTLPPGEEGLLQSHAGGEAIFQQMWAHTKPGYGMLSPYFIRQSDLYIGGVTPANGDSVSRSRSIPGHRRCRVSSMHTLR